MVFSYLRQSIWQRRVIAHKQTEWEPSNTTSTTDVWLTFAFSFEVSDIAQYYVSLQGAQVTFGYGV